MKSYLTFKSSFRLVDVKEINSADNVHFNSSFIPKKIPGGGGDYSIYSEIEHTGPSTGYAEFLWWAARVAYFRRTNTNDSYRNSQQDATVYQNSLFHVYMKLNMFRATHHPSSGAKNCTSSLWFSIRERLLEVEVARRCQRPATSNSNNLSCTENQRLLVQF
jgi:hypothetical protein